MKAKTKRRAKVGRITPKNTSKVAASTKTFNGKRYKKTRCSTTKTAAKSYAKKLRAAGKLARVVDKCVYVRG